MDRRDFYKASGQLSCTKGDAESCRSSTKYNKKEDIFLRILWKRTGSYSLATLNNLFEPQNSHQAIAIPCSSKILARSQPSISVLKAGIPTEPWPSQAHLGSCCAMCVQKHHNTIYLSRPFGIYPSIYTCGVTISPASPILYASSKSPPPNLIQPTAPRIHTFWALYPARHPLISAFFEHISVARFPPE